MLEQTGQPTDNQLGDEQVSLDQVDETEPTEEYDEVEEVEELDEQYEDDDEDDLEEDICRGMTMTLPSHCRMALK